jgi:hypothetical protein
MTFPFSDLPLVSSFRYPHALAGTHQESLEGNATHLLSLGQAELVQLEPAQTETS